MENHRNLWCCCRIAESCPLISADKSHCRFDKCLIIFEEKVSKDWRDSIIISLFKGKGDALSPSNYHGLKLTNHILKVIQRVLENIIRETVIISETQLEFCPVEAQQM